MPIKLRIQAFWADERGAVIIIFALVLTVLLGFVALGVDLSSLYFRQKTLQTRADLAAVSAVNNLSDSPAAYALTTIEGNGLDASAMTSINYGHYQRDPALDPDDRLTDRELSDLDVNAATVSLQEAAPLYFARSFLAQDTTQLGARATAASFDLASFSLASGLSSMNEGLLNALLSEATGSEISLTVLDYKALAVAQIDLLTFSDALATRADLTALTYEDLLTSDVELLDIAGALLDTGVVQGSTAALIAILNSGSNALLDAEKLIGVDGDDVAVQLEDVLPTVTVSALDVLMSSVDVINANRFIDLKLDLNIPGLLETNLKIVVGERPAWIMFAERGATAHTAQVRMKLDLTLDTDILSGLETTLGIVSLDIVSVEVPLYLEIASAMVTLTGLDCGATGGEPLATFDTGTSPLTGVTGTHVAELFLGRFPAPDFENMTTLLDQNDLEEAKLLGLNIQVDASIVPLVPIIINLEAAKLMAKSHVSFGVSEQSQTIFTRSEEGQTKTFGSEALLGSALSSLLTGAETHLEIIGTDLISSLLSTVRSLVADLLDPVLSLILFPLDVVLDSVLELLGIKVGYAELTLHKAHCGRIMLVR
ncbi:MULTISPECIES: pilus assembly protein TadG-related protein [Roseobacteraceae]|uniref:Putative Flp pilus-assembly TadE/G-like protein n=1 Tax=Pseudosulfitobacter pseudonitzschiae TaxID=1402135 RepID=A0A221K7F1_9RHOB|nr:MULTISPECIES: pilus assembly protein TadG-related protein [Roseobacteraceae]ASM74931.1 putative Flp pilus-assembly TadE/G-like protein [Pseudosulfitobacter pseudonitzschiae]